MPELQRKHVDQLNGVLVDSKSTPRQRPSLLSEIEDEITCAERNHKSGRFVHGKLKRRKIVGRIESLAALCGGRDATQCLEKLTQLVAEKTPNDKEPSPGCDFLKECL